MASFIQHAFIICRTLKELTNSAFSIVFSFFPFQIHFLPRNWIASTHACARFIRFIKEAERKKLRLTKKSSSGSLIQFWLNAGENPYSDVLLIENINIFSSARSWLVCSSLLLMFHWKCERTSYVRFFFLLLRALTSGLVKKKKRTSEILHIFGSSSFFFFLSAGSCSSKKGRHWDVVDPSSQSAEDITVLLKIKYFPWRKWEVFFCW